MKTLMTIMAAMAVSASVSVQAGVLAGPITNPANGHVYYLLTQNTWTASQAEAMQLGGNLATINDEAENHWVYTNFGSFGSVARGLWIGFTDANHEGTFEWVDGASSTYTNWAEFEPNNSYGSENYVHILWPGESRQSHWNDMSDVDNYFGFPLNGVVEVIPSFMSIRVSQIEVCWTASTGRWYQVQYKSELTTNRWMNFGPPVAGGNTNCITDSVDAGQPQKFYRVEALP